MDPFVLAAEKSVKAMKIRSGFPQKLIGEDAAVLIKRLTVYHDSLVMQGDGVFQLIGDAIMEIERLSQSQFRWIPVSDGWPDRQGFGPNGILVMHKSGLVETDAHYEPPKTVTHWAPIPPLPEKSQEEKDQARFDSWWDASRSVGPRDAFLAGLKAAREEKA